MSLKSSIDILNYVDCICVFLYNRDGGQCNQNSQLLKVKLSPPRTDGPPGKCPVCPITSPALLSVQSENLLEH